MIAHDHTVLHRERHTKLNWEESIYVDTWQFRCSCGWHTGWVQNHERGQMRANAHAWNGQFSFPWAV